MVSAADSTVSNIMRDEKTGAVKAGVSVAGFDTGKVIEAVQKGVEASLIKPQERLDITNERHEAVSEIELTLNKYLETLKDLRGSSIIAGESGVFGFTTPSYSFINGNAGSEYFTVMLNSGVDPTEVDISITKAAQRDAVKATTLVPDESTTALGITGTLTFPHVDGISPDIVFTLDGTMTAKDIENLVDAQSDATGVNASLIPSGVGYKLSFDAKAFSTPVAFVKNITGGDATQIPATSVALATDLQADIIFRGEPSKHDTNTIILPDMTLTVLQQTQPTGDPTQTVTVGIAHSPLDITEKMSAWVESHNEVLDTIGKYTSLDLDSYDISEEEKGKIKVALLASNSAVQDIERFLSDSVAKNVAGTKASDFGLNIEKNRLSLDVKKLSEALSTDFSSVNNFFAYSEASTNPKISTTEHPATIPSDLTSNAMTVTISKDGGGVLSATFDYAGSTGAIAALNVVEDVTNGYITLEGDPDSIYADFKIYYDTTLVNGQSVNTTMTLSQGIADEGVGFVKRTTGPGGVLEKEHESFTKKIKDQEARIERLKEVGAKKLAQLERRLTAAIQMIQTILAVGNQVRTFEQQSYAAAAA